MQLSPHCAQAFIKRLNAAQSLPGFVPFPFFKIFFESGVEGMSFTSYFNISLDRDARCPAKTDHSCVILSFEDRAKHPIAVSDCLEVFIQRPNTASSSMSSMHPLCKRDINLVVDIAEGF